MNTNKKPWGLTLSDIGSITDREFIHGTNKYLPPPDQIPKVFWSGNEYTNIVNAMYVGEDPPDSEISFKNGFTQEDAPSMARTIMAHLRDVQSDYDHRIAGIAYMIAQIVDVKV